MKRFATTRTSVALAAAVSLGACATPSPYHQLQDFGFAIHTGGYRDRTLIVGNLYSVTFDGALGADADTAERYLLYRCAELTLKAGGDWFEVIRPHTQLVQLNGLIGPPRSEITGALRNDDFGPPPTLANGPTYEAATDIRLGHGAKPANDPQAFDAREVAAVLAPTVKSANLPVYIAQLAAVRTTNRVAFGP